MYISLKPDSITNDPCQNEVENTCLLPLVFIGRSVSAIRLQWHLQARPTAKCVDEQEGMQAQGGVGGFGTIS